MTRAAAVPSGALALAALAFGGLVPGVGAPAGAQLPDGRRALVLSAAATAGAERDRVLSPVRFDGAGAGGELTAAAALAGARVAPGSAPGSRTPPASGGRGGRVGRRAHAAAAVQLAALAPVAAVGRARVLAGLTLDGQTVRAADRVTLAPLPGVYRTGASSAFVTLRPTLQVEGGRRTAVAYALAPAAGGWAWRQYAPGAPAAPGGLAGPGRLGAVEQAVTVSRGSAPARRPPPATAPPSGACAASAPPPTSPRSSSG